MNLIATSNMSIIVGLGSTGLSVVRFLHEQQRPFMVMDTRENPPGLDILKQNYPEVFVHVGSLDESLLLQASQLIVSPGLSINTSAIQSASDAGVEVIGDIELFARHATAPVVAITGTNAKTTVTTLFGQMAVDAGVNVAIGGNIGTPALDLLDEGVELYVLELSSFQLETTYSLNALSATILNVSEDHMDRYQSLADYHRAKQRIYYGAKNVVINRDDVLTHPPLAQNARCISFGLSKPDRCGFGIIYQKGQAYLAYEFTALLATQELILKGRHNLSNCLAALALGLSTDLPMDSMLNTMKGFKGVEHRCQWVRSFNDVDYINDSKATNVGATLAAIEGFAGSSASLILIAGGEGKGADFSPLNRAANQHVVLAILIGRDAKLIAEAIQGVNVVYADSLPSAVAIAKENALPGQTVLLSPACASFDMFANYEARGQQFIDAVNQVAA